MLLVKLYEYGWGAWGDIVGGHVEIQSKGYDTLAAV